MLAAGGDFPVTMDDSLRASIASMDSLHLELARLHFTDARADDGAAHALVLELRLPAGWERLSQAWQGVQSELDLPAPAIAVSGGEGIQLWFPLAAPVARSAGAAFLEGLRVRWLHDVDAARVRLVADPAALPPVPPVEVGDERWSAFVSPDLASVFAETPWLDIPPTDEGQAALLRAIAPIAPEAFEAAKALLPYAKRAG